MKNEPVAWINRKGKNGEHGYLEWDKDDESEINTPLYTHPVKELADGEILKTCIKHGIYDCISDSYIKDDGTNSLDEDLIRFARAILRKASEK